MGLGMQLNFPYIDKPEAKGQSKAQEGFGLWAVSKILWATTTTTPPHPQLLSMKEVSNNKTQRLKVNQYDPLYLLSIKNQVDSKRENMDESNMFKENIIKEMF